MSSETETPETLDCGHVLEKPDHGGTGYGVDSEGKRHCYACCHVRDFHAIKTATRFAGYLHGAEGTITNWPGGKLASRVGPYRVRKMRTPSGGTYDLATFVAKDVHGNLWSCRGQGVGMLVHMKRIKPRKGW